MTVPARKRPPSWRREALRTNLWLVPAVLTVVAVLLFLLTYNLDEAVYRGEISLPWWIISGDADAGRSVLIAIAAAVITVIGVVFSITILALTLASQQFGPRMLRNFIRDPGNQFTLGIFVATFVYSVLALGAITTGPRGPFVPHISITMSLVLLFVDIGVLIYFIHHIAKTIQLPEVIAGIARDLSRVRDKGPSVEELQALLDREGLAVPATESGYLQFVGYGKLVTIALESDAVIRLAHRPGHFVVAGRPLGAVWPSKTAPRVAQALAKGHITGPHRTLTQDPVFAIDQLAEIGIRALSAAVNDTFTALTCIDWISDGLCKISGRDLAEGVYRDRNGRVRLIEFDPSYSRMVDRAYDKIRQSAGGMPAVIIRLMNGIGHVMEYTATSEQRAVLQRQADMILRSAEDSIAEANDRADVRARYDDLVAVRASLNGGVTSPRSWDPPAR
jgi:uncharacterized membrane protein